MILLDRNNKESRQASYEKMKYILKHHGNIIIFPEGYWNLDDNGLADERHGADQHNSENWLVQDINVGVIRLAKETGAPIIPTILHYDEFYKKRCYSKRGKPLYVKEGDNIFSKKDELVDQMTTMYYELMEKYSSYSKEELEKNNLPLQEQWEQLKKDLVKACDIPKIGYKLDLTQEKLIGKAKVANPVTTSQEVFQFTKRK